MGAKSSRGLPAHGLKEPLLPLSQAPLSAGAASTAETRSPPSGPASAPASAPSSFKAGKPRKTKDFIRGDITLRSTLSRAAFEQADVDPRLLDEEKTMQTISEQVASLLSRYVEEGKAKAQERRDFCP
eukprot:g21517.t1